MPLLQHYGYQNLWLSFSANQIASYSNVYNHVLYTTVYMQILVNQWYYQGLATREINWFDHLVERCLSWRSSLQSEWIIAFLLKMITNVPRQYDYIHMYHDETFISYVKSLNCSTNRKQSRWNFLHTFWSIFRRQTKIRMRGETHLMYCSVLCFEHQWGL